MRNLICIGILLLLAGCDRGAQRDSVAPDEAPTATTAATSGEAEAVAPQPSDEKPAEREQCQRDADCRTYFRCFDDTCIVPPAISGEVREDTAVASFHVDGEERAKFNLELAVTMPQKTRGLMFRRSMKDDWGMLFVYPKDGPRSFWMKDTLIPLDMVFIAANGEVVHVIEGAEPMTHTPRRSDEPARYVLELNAGVAQRSGVTKGAIMTLENAPEDVKPAHEKSDETPRP